MSAAIAPRKRGPRKAQTRCEVVAFRVTTDESLAFRLAAERDGLTLAAWIRSMCRRALFQPTDPTTPTPLRKDEST